jgi:hypothetical protein
MNTRHLTRLAFTGSLMLTTLAASLAVDRGMAPLGVAQAANCLTCGGDGGGGGGTGGGVPPTAYVVMGDSFASGQGGQWNGNPATGNPDWVAARHTIAGVTNPTGTYGSSWYWPGMWPTNWAYEKGCHRSDVAESNQPGIANVSFNLACSGAQTVNVMSAANWPGLGQAFKTEIPQVDQLLPIARSYRVKVIVLSIGGNDLTLMDLLAGCVTADIGGGTPCAAGAQATINQVMPGVMQNVSMTIQSIKNVMHLAGYSDSSYRLVLQGYPSPVPAAATFVDPSNQNRTVMGCPLYTADADWAHNTLFPQLRDNLRQVADSNNVQFLDLSHLFDGHELCSTQTTRPNVISPINSATNEWVRALSWAIPPTPDAAGYHEESFHPDAFGQEAIGHCVLELSQQPSSGDYTCAGAANLTPYQVSLSHM